MRVFNTLGRTYEEFVPRDPGKVSMYVCGPTVQSEPHVGHGRFAVAFDVVRRYLMWRGFDVTYVQNVTDVEDKIIAAAQEQGIPVEELAVRMTATFTEVFAKLGVLQPDVEPRATEHISQMQAMIEALMERGHAYESDGAVYFSVRSFPGYGKLSGHRVDELISGARVEPDERKRDPLDFALWKGMKPGEPWWESPWGPGRPGWHIECSAMSLEYLGDGFDIHAGGSDLIFPHHENEIAQSEAATGARFARYWLHNEMINLGGEKMAKSTGHVIDLTDAVERFSPMAVRLFYLRAHYRTPQEYSEDLLADARSAVERLWAFHRRGTPSGEPDPEVIDRFVEAMDDDFNTPEAVSALFEVVREGNRVLDAGGDAGQHFATFATIAGVLGLSPPDTDLEGLAEQLAELASSLDVARGSTPEATIERLLDARSEARARKDWATADTIRVRIGAMGIVIEDTADGARWHRD
jgi:cysteinyl-tRNA synthetase